MNYLICPECGSIYTPESINPPKKYRGQDRFPCVRVDCQGTMWECNELLIPTVLELTKKGYDVVNCDPGHAIGNGCGFITFIDRTYQRQLTKNPPKPPEGWYWEKYYLERHYTEGIRYLVSVNDGKDMREKQIILTGNANSLMNWAYNLEPLRYE